MPLRVTWKDVTHWESQRVLRDKFKGLDAMDDALLNVPTGLDGWAHVVACQKKSNIQTSRIDLGKGLTGIIKTRTLSFYKLPDKYENELSRVRARWCDIEEGGFLTHFQLRFRPDSNAPVFGTLDMALFHYDPSDIPIQVRVGDFVDHYSGQEVAIQLPNGAIKVYSLHMWQR